MTTKGIVRGIVSNLVTVEVEGAVSQNEICYITVGGVRLMAPISSYCMFIIIKHTSN